MWCAVDVRWRDANVTSPMAPHVTGRQTFTRCLAVRPVRHVVPFAFASMLPSANEIRKIAKQTRDADKGSCSVEEFFEIVRSVLIDEHIDAGTVEASMDEMTSFLDGHANVTSCGCAFLSVSADWKRWIQMPPSDRFRSPFRLLERIAMQYPECLWHTLNEDVLELLRIMMSSASIWVYELGVEILMALLCLILGLEMSATHQIYRNPCRSSKHCASQEEMQRMKEAISSQFLTLDALHILCRNLSHGIRDPENRERKGEQVLLRFFCLLLHEHRYQELQPELMGLLETMDFVEILTSLSLHSIRFRSAARLRCINQTIYEYCLADPQTSRGLLKQQLLNAGSQVESRSRAGDAKEEILFFLNLWYYTSPGDDAFMKEVLTWTTTNNIVERLVTYLNQCSLEKDPEAFCMGWAIMARAYHSLLRHLHSLGKSQVLAAECSRLLEIGWIKNAIKMPTRLMEQFVEPLLPNSSMSPDSTLSYMERTLDLLQCGQDVLFFLSLALHQNPTIAEYCDVLNLMSSLLELIKVHVPKLIASSGLEIRVHGARIYVDALSCINELMYQKCTRSPLPCDKMFVRSGLIEDLIDTVGSKERIKDVNIPDRLALIKRCLHILLLLRKYTEETLRSHFPRLVQLHSNKIQTSIRNQLSILMETKQQTLKSMSSVDVQMLKDLQDAENLQQLSGIDVIDIAS